jgi:hypothetical protein
MNVEHDMNVYTGNNWSYQNSNKRFNEKFGSHTKERFNRFTTKDSDIWNIMQNTECIAV